MPGVVVGADGGVAEVADAPVLLRVRSPAVVAVDQARRAFDTLPQRLDLRVRHVFGRPGVEVRIELPAEGPVLVAHHRVLRQVNGLLFRQVAVRLVHSRQGIVERRIAPRLARGGVAFLVEIFAPDRLRPQRVAFGLPFGRGAEPLDGDDLADLVGVKAGETQRDIAAQRMGDDGDWGQVVEQHELGQVEDIAHDRVIAGPAPPAVAVPAQVGADDVPVFAQRLRCPVPAAAVIAPAVKQDQRRCLRVAPVGVVKLRALRDVAARYGSDQVHGPCAILNPRSRRPVRSRWQGPCRRRRTW